MQIMNKLAISIFMCTFLAGAAFAQAPVDTSARKSPAVKSVQTPSSSSSALAKPLNVLPPPPKPNKWAIVKELFL